MKALLPLLLLLSLGTRACAQKIFPAPVNDIVPQRTNLQRPPLAHAPLREADLLWQQSVWRVIDVREKVNHAFAYPERPLVSILLDAVLRQELQAFSPIDDQFSAPMSEGELLAIQGAFDTLPVYDPENPGGFSLEVVAREFDPTTVKRYRLRELWYIDKNNSRMKVRILGIAPIVDELDEAGNLLFERPLFWVNYPNARPLLARERAWATDNETAALSWANLFELRRFDSYVTKQGNVYDRRLKDVHADGRSRLLAGQRSEAERLGRESDLWSW